jgi:hypothetical protein
VVVVVVVVVVVMVAVVVMVVVMVVMVVVVVVGRGIEPEIAPPSKSFFYCCRWMTGPDRGQAGGWGRGHLQRLRMHEDAQGGA